MRYVLLGGVGLALLAAALAWTFIANEGAPGARGPGPVASAPMGSQPPVPPPLAPLATERSATQGAATQGPAAQSPATQAPGAQSPAPQASVTTAPSVQPNPAATAPSALAPSFDVVRIKPNGDAVFAGRAAPGAKVAIVDGGRVIGETVADARGEWVFLPTEALPPGSRELGLTARHADGSVTESASVVVLFVPDRVRPSTVVAAAPPAPTATPAPVAAPQGTETQARPAAGPTPAAIPPAPATQAAAAPSGTVPSGAVPPGTVPPGTAPSGVVAVVAPRSGEGPTRLLQVPGDGAKTAATGVTVDIVDYDEKGDLLLSGRAAAGSNVTVYLNNQAIGQATVDQARQWQMKPPQSVQPGQYQMRADETSPQGKVVSRVELPFMRAVAQRPPTAGETRVVVQPGNSLWRIARHRYGEGERFTVIYAANKDQIRDPDLIYPGQVFEMPSVN